MYVVKACFAGWDVATGQWWSAGVFGWFAHPRENSVARSSWSKILSFGNETRTDKIKSNGAKVESAPSNVYSISSGAPVFSHARLQVESIAAPSSRPMAYRKAA